MEKDSTIVYISGWVIAVTRREVTIRAQDKHGKLRLAKLASELCAVHQNLTTEEGPIQVPQWWAHQNKIPFKVVTVTGRIIDPPNPQLQDLPNREHQMNLHDYQPLAMRTAKLMADLQDTLVHGAMGCGSEAGELALTAADYQHHNNLDAANLREEIGDGFWFATYVANAMGLQIAALQVFNKSTLPPKHYGAKVDSYLLAQFALRLCAAGSDIETMVKAHKFYGKGLDALALETALARYVGFLTTLCDVCGFTVGEVLQANIEKLRKRYGDKYSDVAAIARADKAEEATVSLHTHAAHVHAGHTAPPTDSAELTMERSVAATFTGQGGSFDGSGATAEYSSSSSDSSPSSSD